VPVDEPPRRFAPPLLFKEGKPSLFSPPRLRRGAGEAGGVVCYPICFLKNSSERSRASFALSA
jgi:hypothetical protein